MPTVLEPECLYFSLLGECFTLSIDEKTRKTGIIYSATCTAADIYTVTKWS